MTEITYVGVFVFITVLWVIVRVIVAVKERRFDVRREAMLLTVYICLVVIARMVYFPLHLENGHIGKTVFDIHSILPFKINLIPIVNLFEQYAGWKVNIIGNTAMFIPVGIFWPLCFKKLDNIGKTVLAGGGLSLFIELSQLLLVGRTTDVDDLMLNTAGVFIGAVIYFVIAKPSKPKGHTEQSEVL